MRRCRTIRVHADKSDDGQRNVVLITLGNLRRPSQIDVDKVAWIEMAPGMAESIARDLLEVASEVRLAKGDHLEESPDD